MIEEVTSHIVQNADFSSRVRTPREGEVVLWKNTNGLLCAVRINRVTLTPESQIGTILDADYRILRDGGDDFSNEDGRGRSEVRRALQEASIALELAEGNPAISNADDLIIGIGHNGPPEQVSPPADLAQSVAEVLTHASDLVCVETPDTTLIQEMKEKVAGLSLAIRKWVATRLEELSSSATKAVGVGLGTSLLASVTNWQIVAEKLSSVADAFVKAFGL
ncbi:hypothetical protein [Hasllibacter halocynthiae]|uniref:hypothetical protein n=1 Tax=Hasllibacter halocynthiae TaxID=595589 RepID=UPI0011B20A57|nr:hypothetical protein [Hasllibacter halocynthiae]